METFVSFLSMLGAVAAALYARRALAPSMAAVLSEWLTQYSDEQFGKDMASLRGWQKQHGANFATTYVASVQSDPAYESLAASRRRVSQFFKNIARLNRTGLIDDRVLAQAFGQRPFDFCVEVLEPLDQALSTSLVGEPDDPYWKAFYERIRSKARELGVA